MRDGPRNPDELAAETATRAPSLRRFLRALAGSGIFSEGEAGCFHLTPLATPLCGDAPDSLRAYAVMAGERWVWQSVDAMEHSLRTGAPAFKQVFGAPVFAYYAVQPEAARIGAEVLASVGRYQDAAILATYDFPETGTVVDIGGGQGALLAAFLASRPDLHGTLFERAQVIEFARSGFDKTDLAGRCGLVAGDFFTEVPRSGDLYLLRKVIHNWEDEPARRILCNCRDAMGPNSRLLLAEAVVPPGNAPSYAKLLDLLMLVYAGGRERTEAEYGELLASAGLRTTRVMPTGSALSLIEAVVA